ncbi:MAG: 5'-3' exonuclease H3TH domain-containing protein [Planctomycetota bacterium]
MAAENPSDGISTRSIHVLDGTAMLFRSYFGMGKFRSPRDLEVAGVMGMGQTLARLYRDLRPQHLTVVFDAAKLNFRHEIYPDYKANREAPPEDMTHQFDLAARLVDELGFPFFRILGYEADDLMATMAYRATKAGVKVVLVTPDKDVLQLVDDNVEVLDGKGSPVFDAAAVEKKLGVPPHRVVDLLALAGDSSDNVPGVRGVGPKSAVALIQALGGLDDIYENLDRVPELAIRGSKSLAAKLEAGRESAFLSRRLVVLDQEVPLSDESLTLGSLRWRRPKPSADAFFDELGFHGPLRTLRAI